LVGRPPGADGDETRERIMEAALEAFAEHGYDAMSVRELTRRLGVSHNLVHHYFGSKSDLWYAAVEHSLGQSTTEILTHLERSIGDSDPLDSVRRLLRVTFIEAARHPAVLSIIADESGRGGERLDFLYERFLEPAVEITGRFLEGARPHGICDMDPTFLALHVLSSTSLMFTHHALFEKLGYSSSPSPEMLEAYARSTADLMLKGLFG
jgi:AcrR family transcriptional regulator